MTWADAGSAFARATLYAGLTLAAGRAVVDGVGTSRGAVRGVRPLSRLGAALVVMAPLLLLQLQLDALEMTRADLPVLLGETAWGHAWVVLTGAALAVSILLVPERWGTPPAALLRLLSVVAMSLAMSGLGHAAADAEWPLLSRAADTLHALAAAAWIGGLLWTTAITSDRPEAAQRAAWRAFSGVATVAAPLVLLTGMLASWRRLAEALPTGVATIATTPYGTLLLCKVVLAVGVLALGARQRRRLMASMPVEGAVVRTELLLALAVFAITAVLTGTELPAAP